jgi:hypothetical protein
MKQFVVLAALVFGAVLPLRAQSNDIIRAGDGLWFMYYDSSQSKSTIVEFDDFVVMIEVPVKDEGGGARVLREHADGGEKAIRTLKEAFPGKPLRYVIHSHWHPHSISSVRPFLEAGATLVSTRKNFERLKEFVDSATVAKYPDRITFIEGDSLVIEAPGNRIVAHRFTQEEYPNAPTADYLYCYLPRYNYLHCACMYNKWTGENVEGKELLTGREEDVYRFLSSRNLRPEYLIRLNREKKEPNDLQPYSGLEEVVKNGISAAKLSERFTALDAATVRASRDSVLRSVVEGNIPAPVINRAVYQAARADDLPKAIELAHLQALAAPADPNAWDTLGEMYYAAGDTTMARAFGKRAKMVSPSFDGGGEAAWKKSIDERRMTQGKPK